MPKSGLNKKIVLIVEDEVALLYAFKEEFMSAGFEVFEAKNGKEGLDIAIGKHPDMILLDILMPVMDGLTMLKKLREDAWGKNAQVIILTNLNDVQKVSEALTSVTFDYLVKADWKIEDIVKKVKERLKDKLD
ncbi:MAG: response regulator [bacterium]|nr:response regulator [bacterium]